MLSAGTNKLPFKLIGLIASSSICLFLFKSRNPKALNTEKHVPSAPKLWSLSSCFNDATLFVLRTASSPTHKHTKHQQVMLVVAAQRLGATQIQAGLSRPSETGPMHGEAPTDWNWTNWTHKFGEEFRGTWGDWRFFDLKGDVTKQFRGKVTTNFSVAASEVKAR